MQTASADVGQPALEQTLLQLQADIAQSRRVVRRAYRMALGSALLAVGCGIALGTTQWRPLHVRQLVAGSILVVNSDGQVLAGLGMDPSDRTAFILRSANQSGYIGLLAGPDGSGQVTVKSAKEQAVIQLQTQRGAGAKLEMVARGQHGPTSCWLGVNPAGGAEMSLLRGARESATLVARLASGADGTGGLECPAPSSSPDLSVRVGRWKDGERQSAGLQVGENRKPSLVAAVDQGSGPRVVGISTSRLR